MVVYLHMAAITQLRRLFFITQPQLVASLFLTSALCAPSTFSAMRLRSVLSLLCTATLQNEFEGSLSPSLSLHSPHGRAQMQTQKYWSSGTPNDYIYV